MAKTKGLKPSKRKMATQKKGKKLTGNQWQNTPQQNLFMEYWLSPKIDGKPNPTFSNAYQSAIKAGYSPKYANQIISRKSAQNWINDYVRNNVMDIEHVRQGIQDLALNTYDLKDSRSPADTRLKAYELLGKATGFLNEKGNTTNVIVQPILGGASVEGDERLKVDVDQ